MLSIPNVFQDFKSLIQNSLSCGNSYPLVYVNLMSVYRALQLIDLHSDFGFTINYLNNSYSRKSRSSKNSRINRKKT